MDDIITFSGLNWVLKVATNWSYACLDTFEHESTMVSILFVSLTFLSDLMK